MAIGLAKSTASGLRISVSSSSFHSGSTSVRQARSKLPRSRQGKSVTTSEPVEDRVGVEVRLVGRSLRHPSPSGRVNLAASGAAMPGSRFRPPSDGRQNGLRVASTWRAGSQNPIDRPIVGFTPQLQTGLPGCRVVLLSTEVGDRGAADGDGQQARPADVSQRIGNLPVQVARPAAVASEDAASRQ